MIPLLHDFTGERVLVFGGGPVGARKARRFSREASVVVVSPAFADAAFGGADLVRAAPAPDAVEAWVARTDPALVVAATDDDAVNEAVADAATDRGVLVNRADEHGGRGRARGSVVVPATVRDDQVVVAVGTGGTSPALSRYLRRRIETEIADAGEMARLSRDLRAELRETDAAPERRHEAVRAVVGSTAVWKALDSGDDNPRDVAVDVIEDVIEDVPGDPS